MTSYRYKIFSVLNRECKTLCKVNIFQQENTIKAAIISGYKIKLTLLLFLVLLGKQTAYANVPNTIWANPGENDFIVEMGNISFPSYLAGTTVVASYVTQVGPSGYAVNLDNETGKSAVYYYALVDSPLPVSDINPGYLKLSDFLDIKIFILSGGILDSWFFMGTYAAGKGPSRSPKTWRIGLNGYLSLRLRKDVIGGAAIMPRDQVVASNFFLSMFVNGMAEIPRNPLPVFRIILKGQTLPVPVQCSIQADKRDVDFRDLSSTDITLDGSRYGQEIQLTYRCNTPRTLPIKINMLADNSTFSSNYIATSNPDLGIVVKHSGKTVKPWTSFDSRLVNGTGSDRIYVAPVKNPTAKTIATGDFTANAVLVLSIQ
ncbi:fimbrial protein [Serratia sp. UGAL515B_01]|uniref:fimbrial protein n=1 Tax=Serratia sp. UGAL515B_01 TaxID=2986763 RepID=UPI0029535827|nr:fimbrial protein [Serratia sp. UGAL515B_01]WON77627.1 fimbrial protein [Serratia sp. UGAL515B_01]